MVGRMRSAEVVAIHHQIVGDHHQIAIVLIDPAPMHMHHEVVIYHVPFVRSIEEYGTVLGGDVVGQVPAYPRVAILEIDPDSGSGIIVVNVIALHEGAEGIQDHK